MYEWLKVVHLLAVFAWMAGLFYLPRLFVYHADTRVGSETDLTFVVMERRLLKAIMRPSAVVALVSGGGLLHVLGYPIEQAWLWLKLLAVGCMFAFHGWLEGFALQFARGGRLRSSRFFRIINEIPTVLLIVIVIAVVVRPFL